jgi:hypothetical protein
MTSGTIFDDLIRETSDLDRRAKAVQGDRTLLVDDKGIEALIHAYHEWYAGALAALPEELREKFRDLYEGGFFHPRIKAFLEGLGRVNPMFDPSVETGLISYWEQPFEMTFRPALLEQRQLLVTAKHMMQEREAARELTTVEQVGRGLPMLIAALR